jgi:hypothetical protein
MAKVNDEVYLQSLARMVHHLVPSQSPEKLRFDPNAIAANYLLGGQFSNALVMRLEDSISLDDWCMLFLKNQEPHISWYVSFLLQYKSRFAERYPIECDLTYGFIRSFCARVKCDKACSNESLLLIVVCLSTIQKWLVSTGRFDWAVVKYDGFVHKSIMDSAIARIGLSNVFLDNGAGGSAYDIQRLAREFFDA